MIPATCVPWPYVSAAAVAPALVTTDATTREVPSAPAKSGRSPSIPVSITATPTPLPVVAPHAAGAETESGYADASRLLSTAACGVPPEGLGVASAAAVEAGSDGAVEAGSDGAAVAGSDGTVVPGSAGTVGPTSAGGVRAGSAAASTASAVTACGATPLWAVTATTRGSRAMADTEPADIRAATALMIGSVPVTWPPAARTSARPTPRVVPGRSRTIWVAGRGRARAGAARSCGPTATSTATRTRGRSSAAAERMQ